MKKMILTAAVTMMASSAAVAAKGTTEYYFQPGAGASALTVVYGMMADPAKTEPSGGGAESDLKTTTSDLGLDYAYGLSETMALGAYTMYGSLKQEYGTASETATGLGDIHLYMKGFADMIHYGVDLGINMGKAKQKTASSAFTNRTSGGLSLKANVGVMMNSASWNYGGDLSYMMPLERSYEGDPTGGGKFKGGNTAKLAGFGEYNWGMGFAGAELAYLMRDDTTVTPDTGAESKLKGESFLALTAYGTYDFNDMVSGLASLGVENHTSHDLTDATGSSKVKAYMGTNVALGVRVHF